MEDTEKLGIIPSTVISIIQYFYKGMFAKAIAGQEFTDSIDISIIYSWYLCVQWTTSGLYTVVPVSVLFSLYFGVA